MEGERVCIGLEETCGSLEESCSLLQVDLVTGTRLVCQVDGSFLKLFWAFRHCFCTYKSQLRRILCVVGTHLIEKYFGTLSVACGCDAKKTIPFHRVNLYGVEEQS